MSARDIWLLLLMAPAACKPPPDDRNHMPGANAERGRLVIERVACAACHVIPGIDWPEGQLGPSLDGFADQALIAGRFPNRPDLLAQWVRNAPSMVPDSAMPQMPLTEGEARDVAAYLYTLHDR